MVVRITADLKQKAIELRRGGLSYSEILRQIPVAKSTIALWLRSVGLSKRQKQRLTRKKLMSARRGAVRKHEIKLELVRRIREGAQKDINEVTNHDLWLIGVMLYWAEGSKEKQYRSGQQVQFSNSDPKMIALFRKWLIDIIKINKEDMTFEIYIHETGNVDRALQFWARILSCSEEKIRVYFKRHTIKRTNRKNIGETYYGVLRLRVKKSSNLNRKIAAWVDIICDHCGIV